MADINLKEGNADYINLSDGDITIGNQGQSTTSDSIVVDTPIINQIISNTDIETTDDVPEGTSNLYYTDARVDARINQADIVLDDVYTDADFDARLATRTTDHLTEGSNLYYTNSRARSAIGVSGDLSYNSQTGVISYTTPTFSSDVTSVNSLTGAVVLNTDNINEGNNNLYYTDQRFDNKFSSKSTTDLAEGTNLYYTDTRARLAISAGGDLSYNSTTGVISYTTPAVSNAVNSVNTQTGTVVLDTDDIAEGTNNLYYTDARVDARAQLKIDQILDSAPGSLDTLNELASALGDDPNFATTMTNNLALKLNISDFNSTFDTRLATKSTTDISEGSNLYFTDARVDTHLNTSNATSGQVLNWNGTDYTWVTPTTYTVYTDADVDTHLNTSSALNNQVLSWNGTDYVWTLLPSTFDGQFSSLTGVPTTISGYGITDAFDGDYNNLTNKPTLFDGDYNNLTNKPTLFDGDYNSLSNKPTLVTALNDLSDVNTSSIDNGYLVYSQQAGSHNIQALHISHDTSPDLGGNLNTNSHNITGGLKLSDNGIIETFDTHTGIISTITLNAQTSHSLYISSASNNKTLNVTNLSLSNNQGSNITIIWNQGSTPYMVNALNVNGTSQTINWQGGSTPNGTANGVDIISFTIYYTGSTYVVMGQSVSYS